MTPEEKLLINQKLKEVAEILYNNTSDTDLQTFETRDWKISSFNPTLIPDRSWDLLSDWAFFTTEFTRL